MLKIEDGIKLDFCDVLIRPKRSLAPSRASVDVTREFKFGWRGVPIIAANMDSVGSMKMAREMAKLGAMTCLHKHYSVENLIEFFNTTPENTFYTLGIKEEDFEKIKLVSKSARINWITVDAANGYTQFFAEKVKQVRDNFPDALIMCGNVATPEMVHELIANSGADIVKIGIGPGSVCTTRLITGCGYPQLSAIAECADAAHGVTGGRRGYICADGGCIHPGDVAKAFGAGADFVMLGGMLSGTEECEGDWELDETYESEAGIVEQVGDSKVLLKEYSRTPMPGFKLIDSKKKALKFYGMSSQEAMNKYNGKSKYRAAEGKCVEIPYKGKTSDVMQQILGGLRSACAYCGAEKLKDFPKCCTFVKVNRTHNNSLG